MPPIVRTMVPRGCCRLTTRRSRRHKNSRRHRRSLGSLCPPTGTFGSQSPRCTSYQLHSALLAYAVPGLRETEKWQRTAFEEGRKAEDRGRAARQGTTGRLLVLNDFFFVLEVPFRANSHHADEKEGSYVVSHVVNHDFECRLDWPTG